ncbi:LacI family DNA-binding transcriptional regulator [Priestia filamentosa]|uniref:Transcriptional regulator n=1 Tax=Priestia filamentosa TaxID=1402861 RepID=A0A1X7E7Z8_9BACI|nr:LacI family DNA-binding transcriptional regulator [Priestia filamentosa]AKO92567.1 transcriptional regulator [Priestia filamentosa]MDT3762643.1 LacI family DNA-binding transcriptional regulator [Priestia filamentosa]OXS69180.1 LacI family transcriptional regulator [Priestia filamentosa]RJS64108.1 LacI family transcriptional regulator [Priestia filamentosa]WCM17709.1 LacI family DNA-binding transcriptional regulator [Priestia filamentosa]
MKITIRSVAEEAGVSIGTVSKVINNSGKISEKTRKKVFQAMQKLNYKPDAAAASLRGKRTKLIGLLVPDISNPFYAGIARSIEDRSHEVGLNVMLCSTDNNTEKEKNYLALLTSQRVDGLVVASAFRSTVLLQETIDRGIPSVLIASEIPQLSINTVTVDDYKGGYLATSHLLDLGHKDIAIISENVRSNEPRLAAYKDSMREAGIDVKPEYIMKTEATIQKGYECAKKLLLLDEKPTAIFACNDLLAAGVIQAAKELELDLPRELSVVGFDNTVLSTTTAPMLTTISQPIKQMGAKVVDLLRQEMEESKGHKERLLMAPELIVRQSTASI